MAAAVVEPAAVGVSSEAAVTSSVDAVAAEAVIAKSVGAVTRLSASLIAAPVGIRLAATAVGATRCVRSAKSTARARWLLTLSPGVTSSGPRRGMSVQAGPGVKLWRPGVGGRCRVRDADPHGHGSTRAIVRGSGDSAEYARRGRESRATTTDRA